MKRGCIVDRYDEEQATYFVDGPQGGSKKRKLHHELHIPESKQSTSKVHVKEPAAKQEGDAEGVHMASGFQVGDRVRAFYKKGTVLYPGKIIAIPHTDHFNIHYDDGDHSIDLPLKYVQPELVQPELELSPVQPELSPEAASGEGEKATYFTDLVANEKSRRRRGAEAKKDAKPEMDATKAEAKAEADATAVALPLIHISEPTRPY